jgi:hypothetical protein
MKDFDRPILIGVIFDLSTTYNGDGSRNIDIVKEVLLKVLDKQVMAKIYVSHPDWHTLPRDQGESTYYVASYQEPSKFSIDVMFKNAVTLVGEDSEDSDKYVFLITDRFQAPVNFHYRKGFLANNIRGYSTKICVFGIGDNYDSLTLKSIAGEYDAYYAHLFGGAASLFESVSELLVVGA